MQQFLEYYVSPQCLLRAKLCSIGKSTGDELFVLPGHGLLGQTIQSLRTPPLLKRICSNADLLYRSVDI